MADKNPPAAACTECGKYNIAGDRINQPCSEVINKRRCKGAFGSLTNENDWKHCIYCSGSGCEICEQTGWIFNRQ